MRTRRRLLWLSIIATTGLATAGYDAIVDRQDRTPPGRNASTRTAPPTPVAERRARQRSLLDLEKLQALRAQTPTAELFARKSWYIAPPLPPPPPPPPQAPPPPVAPTAPPLPFVFMGRMTDAERLTVFLVKDNRVYMVSEGDVIDGTYKLEKIEPRQVTFLYLPLDVTQTLAVGESP